MYVQGSIHVFSLENLQLENAGKRMENDWFQRLLSARYDSFLEPELNHLKSLEGWQLLEFLQFGR